ncbi:MAG: hypothetical protein Ct9H90mP23_0060 [Methanobacteriota archaeon]|nr:MAG: hypothetical protein Ct9H90mP23_0060 [Euryarchaeota archaeon]
MVGFFVSRSRSGDDDYYYDDDDSYYEEDYEYDDEEYEYEEMIPKANDSCNIHRFEKHLKYMRNQFSRQANLCSL